MTTPTAVAGMAQMCRLMWGGNLFESMMFWLPAYTLVMAWLASTTASKRGLAGIRAKATRTRSAAFTLPLSVGRVALLHQPVEVLAQECQQPAV